MKNKLLCVLAWLLTMFSAAQAMAQVTSVSGDGTIISNSGSTGAVTLTLENATAKSLLGNSGSSAGAPSYLTSPTVSGTLTGAIYNATTAGTGYEIGGTSVLFLPDGDTTSIAVGESALAAQSATGSSNTALGDSALTSITTGTSSTAVGYEALYKTTGINTAVGFDAGEYVTSGPHNVAVGYNAMQGISATPLTGGYSAAFGDYSLSRVQGASTSNMAIGYGAGSQISTGSYNVAIGELALASATTGNGSVALGLESLDQATGSPNTAIGEEAGFYITSGADNIAIGYLAMSATSAHPLTGSDNIAIGDSAMYSITGGAAENVAVGYDALTSIGSGSYNTAVGYEALQSDNDSSGSTAFGYLALQSNTANYSTAFGYQALQANTTGTYNTAVGYDALYQSTGNYNTVLGNDAGAALTTGSDNTLVGYAAGYQVTGHNNVIMGDNGGGSITSGSYNIIIGSGLSSYTASTSNQIDIGDIIVYDGSKTTITSSLVADASVFFPSVGTTASAANVYMNNASSPTANQILRVTSSLRYKKDVENLTDRDFDEVTALHPVKFHSRSQADDPGRWYTGLIAEEVNEIDPRFVNFTSDPADSSKLIPDGVQYDRIVVLLIGKVQEQQKAIDDLKAEMKTRAEDAR